MVPEDEDESCRLRVEGCDYDHEDCFKRGHIHIHIYMHMHEHIQVHIHLHVHVHIHTYFMNISVYTYIYKASCALWLIYSCINRYIVLMFVQVALRPVSLQDQTTRERCIREACTPYGSGFRGKGFRAEIEFRVYCSWIVSLCFHSRGC